MAEKIPIIPNPVPPKPTNQSVVLSGRTLGLNFLKGRIIKFVVSRNNQKVGGESKDISVNDTTRNTELQQRSQLGTVKFGQFIIKTSEDVQIGDSRTFFQNGQGYAILESAVGSISQDRNIITTPIQGRNGTVKEYISDGDFVIEVTGKIVDTQSKFPDDQVQDIANIFKVPNEIIIVNSFLYNFDIKNVVIKSYKISQVEGYDNMYEISFTMLSDDPIELKLGIVNA